MLTVLSQASVLLLNLLQPSPAAVGAYAAAASIVTPAVVFVTATNRAYVRQLSISLDARDLTNIAAMRAARLRRLLPPVVLGVLGLMLFARPLLLAFGQEYANEGTVPLRILAMTAAFTMIFSLAPTYVKFTTGRHATILLVVTAAAIQIALLCLLVPVLGATGAALAHSASLIGMYGGFAVIGWRHLHGRT